MPRITTSGSDVLWNYISTVLSTGSSIMLLPFLLACLSDSELGLWYSFVAVGNLTLLFEFGFTPTFARNIVYCLSGARRLSKSGIDASSVREGIDYRMLSGIMMTSKLLYACIAAGALAVMGTVGSVYIAAIAQGVDAVQCWIAWAIFCVAIFLNLFFFHYTTCLRGFGDIAAESKAKSYGRIVQLGVSAVALIAGFGLIGAAIGYLFNGLVMRICSAYYLKRHSDVIRLADEEGADGSFSTIREVLSAIFPLAWRDGIVQISCYASTQASSLLCSYFLGLSANSQYSLLVQIGGAIYGFGSVYVRSVIPMFQSSYAEGDCDGACGIMGRSLVVYWILVAVCSLGVLVVGFPILGIIKPDFTQDVALYLFVTLYLVVWNHHSLCCNYIVSTNEVPYLPAYVLSAIGGVALSVVLLLTTEWGIWSIVVGNAAVQLVYNNWHWPHYLAAKFGVTYPSCLKRGLVYWRERIMDCK